MGLAVGARQREVRRHVADFEFRPRARPFGRPAVARPDCRSAPHTEQTRAAASTSSNPSPFLEVRGAVSVHSSSLAARRPYNPAQPARRGPMANFYARIASGRFSLWRPPRHRDASGTTGSRPRPTTSSLRPACEPACAWLRPAASGVATGWPFSPPTTLDGWRPTWASSGSAPSRCPSTPPTRRRKSARSWPTAAHGRCSVSRSLRDRVSYRRRWARPGRFRHRATTRSRSVAVLELDGRGLVRLTPRCRSPMSGHEMPPPSSTRLARPPIRRASSSRTPTSRPNEPARSAVIHVTETDGVLGVLPLFHALAQMANLLAAAHGRARASSFSRRSTRRRSSTRCRRATSRSLPACRSSST